MSISQNKTIARRFFEEFDRRAFDAIRSLLTPDEVAHLPGAPEPLDWPAHQRYTSTFVEDQVADAKSVVTRLTFRGTHTGAFMGVPATGKSIAISGISWFRMNDGHIAEEWTEFDRLGLMMQLGVASPPPPSGPLTEGKPAGAEHLAALAEPRGVVRRWFERIDRGGVPDVDQYVVRGYTDHNPPPIQGLGPGATGVKQAFTFALEAFGEFHHEIAATLSEGDKVASRVTGYGKHTGDFLGIPATGKQVSMTGISIHRVQDGRLSEHWAQIDALSLLQQMGAIPQS